MRLEIQGTDLSHDTQQGELTEVSRFPTHVGSRYNLESTTLTRVRIVGNEFMTGHQRIPTFSNDKSIGEFGTDFR
jgi:hypothetical protein